jgi:hypothetical protein
MPPPINLHKLKSMQGHLSYIRRFISNLSGRCKPLSRLMKKGVPFEWDQACQCAFFEIKRYLIDPPVLDALVKDRPCIDYIYTGVICTSLCAFLALNNVEERYPHIMVLVALLDLHPITRIWKIYISYY